MLRNRLTALLIAAAIVMMMLSGCGGENDASGATLRTMTIFGDEREREVYSSLLLDFSSKHKELYLQDTTASSKDAFKLDATLENTYDSSTSPHVVYYYNNTGIEQLCEYFVPIEEIRKDYPDFASGINEQILDALKNEDGNTYCVPINGECALLGFNKGMLAEGFPAQGWNSIADCGDMLGGQTFGVANSPDSSAIIIEQLVAAYGGAQAVRAGLDGDEQALKEYWLPALRDYQTLCTSGAIAPPAFSGSLTDYVSASDFDKYKGIFADGWDASTQSDEFELANAEKAAMLYFDSGECSRLSKEIDYSIILPPAPFGSKYFDAIICSFDCGFYITRRAYNDPLLREAAVSYVDYMTSAEAGAKFARMGYIPANRDVVLEDGTLSEIIDQFAVAQDIVISSRTPSNSTRWSMIEQYAAQMYFYIITPEQMTELLCDDSLDTDDVVSASDADADTYISDSDASGSDLQ